MKHSKDRLSPREIAAGVFVALGLLALSCGGDKPYMWIASLLVGLACWTTAAVILNVDKIKNYLRRK